MLKIGRFKVFKKKARAAVKTDHVYVPDPDLKIECKCAYCRRLVGEI